MADGWQFCNVPISIQTTLHHPCSSWRNCCDCCIRLPPKQNSVYEELLRAVLDRCSEYMLYPDPLTVLVDFELSVINAVRSELGPHVNIQGCFYHLTQSTWRHIQNLGLVNPYKDSEEVRHFCTKLDALAFLPPADVSEGMAHLRDRVPDVHLEPLVEYFDRTYVTGSHRPVQRRPNLPGGPVPPLLLRHIPPTFSAEIWNVLDATLTDGPRTNNLCEAWNNRFMNVVGHKHPTIWRAITSIQQEKASVSALILQDSRGQPPKKRVKRSYRNLQQRLNTLCQDYNKESKSLPEFLEGIAHTIHFNMKFNPRDQDKAGGRE